MLSIPSRCGGGGGGGAEASGRRTARPGRCVHDLLLLQPWLLLPRWRMLDQAIVRRQIDIAIGFLIRVDGCIRGVAVIRRDDHAAHSNAARPLQGKPRGPLNQTAAALIGLYDLRARTAACIAVAVAVVGGGCGGGLSPLTALDLVQGRVVAAGNRWQSVAGRMLNVKAPGMTRLRRGGGAPAERDSVNNSKNTAVDQNKDRAPSFPI